METMFRQTSMALILITFPRRNDVIPSPSHHMPMGLPLFYRAITVCAYMPLGLCCPLSLLVVRRSSGW